MSFLLSVFIIATTSANTPNPGIIPGSEQVVTGRVIALSSSQCVIDDSTKPFVLHGSVNTKARPGDCVEVVRQTARHDHGGTSYALQSMTLLSRGSPPVIRPATLASVCRGDVNLTPVRIHGHVEDISVDEVDPDHRILILRSDSDTIAVPLSEAYLRTIPDSEHILRAEIEITGICYPEYQTIRFYKGPIFLPEGTNAVKIIRPAPQDAFNCPPIPFGRMFSPAEITSLGLRTVSGRVVAVWGGNKLLLSVEHELPSPQGLRTTFHYVDLPHGIATPSVGECIQALGHPETDTYRINLSRANWRSLAKSDSCEGDRPSFALSDVMSVNNGRITYHANAVGRVIRLRGTVSALPIPGTTEARLHLLSDGVDVSLDASACPESLQKLRLGDRISVNGVCLFEIENWRPNAPRPRIQGFFLALRSPADIVVLSHPSWWTNGQLFLLIGILVALLIGVLAWNRSLNRLALKRGRALAEEQIERSLSELKIEERTRLAVELHDSLSQNLAGVACQIGAMKNAIDHERDLVKPRLQTVERMLKSTREELRNCLFDLRSDIIDDPDMANAIRRTLDGAEIDAKTSVRFDVPRDLLLDSTAHAILSIIRELAGNAVRHGHATQIRVAGSVENGHLRFSVKDNGSGFDPDKAPGLPEGHFGLDGIRNRASGFNGTFTISSDHRHGTRAIIDIPLPSSFPTATSS